MLGYIIFISNQRKGIKLCTKENIIYKGSLTYYLHVDTLINVYHKEEVISSACATEQYLNRQSCSTCFFVQDFW